MILGTHAQQRGGEVNEYNQETKADKGKPQLHLVPTEIIHCIARVREYGTEKYKSPDNWKRLKKTATRMPCSDIY